MTVTSADISQSIAELGLSNKPICIHSSLRSFGWVKGGAEAVVQGLLNQGCTILAPTFSSKFAAHPPDDLRPLRNGCGDYSRFNRNRRLENNIPFTSSSNEVDKVMGAIPRTILNMHERKRGNHPLNSFTAMGPLAVELISGQAPTNVYAPLEKLAELNGSVILMGVGLERLTLLHLAEKKSGRKMFRRWAKDASGKTISVEVGGCSEGFSTFNRVVEPISRKLIVGNSPWQIFDVKALLEITIGVIQQNPRITRIAEIKIANDVMMPYLVDRSWSKSSCPHWRRFS